MCEKQTFTATQQESFFSLGQIQSVLFDPSVYDTENDLKILSFGPLDKYEDVINDNQLCL